MTDDREGAGDFGDAFYLWDVGFCGEVVEEGEEEERNDKCGESEGGKGLGDGLERE